MSLSWLGEKLVEWYGVNGRRLPWRETTDPYKIWISEIILQQTRVAQGRDYYERFISRFPDVQSLASASDDEVMRLWQGLGYYTRARNLLKAAHRIAQMPFFPRDYDTLLTLNGIGRYTAAAVASISSGQPVAVVDGNVYRVIARFCCERTPIDTTAGRRRFDELASRFLLRNCAAVYNQAIMDFGALICTPRSPQCNVCPLAERCQALSQDMVTELPVKSRKSQQAVIYMIFVEVRHASRGCLLHRRDQKGIWQGLYEPVVMESDHMLTPRQVAQSEELRPILSAGSSALKRVLKGVKHVLTHRIILADYYVLSTDAAYCPEGYFYAADPAAYAVPVLLSKLRRQSGGGV